MTSSFEIEICCFYLLYKLERERAKKSVCFDHLSLSLSLCVCILAANFFIFRKCNFLCATLQIPRIVHAAPAIFVDRRKTLTRAEESF